MRYLCADIDGARHAIQGIKVFREGLPFPGNPLGECCSRDILHVLHDLDHALTFRVIRLAGRKADTAVTHHQGGNTVIGGRAAVGVPGGLAIHMRVCVHPPRGHHQPPGVYHLACLTLHIAHRDNAPVEYRDIADKGRLTAAVNNLSITNE